MDNSKVGYWTTAFPNLDAAGFEKTSNETPIYNCIAWALGISDEWWSDYEDENTRYSWVGDRVKQHIDGLVRVFEHHGYEPADGPEVEQGFGKVVLYVKLDKPEWSHAARQRPDGRWTTKHACAADFTHAKPECLCPHYGKVYCYMRKPLGNASV